MQYQVRHYMPGRIRIYLPCLGENPETGKQLEQFIRQQPEVTQVRVNPACACVVIEFTGDVAPWLSQLSLLTWEQVRLLLSAFIAEPADKEDRKEHGSPKPVTAPPEQSGSLLLTSASFALSLLPFTPLAAASLPLTIWNSLPIWKRALSVLSNERRLNVDFLDGLATAIALGQAQLTTASFITWLISLGDWIRNRTAAQSKRAMTGLLEYQNRSAWVLRDGEPVRVLATEIQAEDTVMIYAGDMIPVDGQVQSGEATVDQKMVTGESVPVVREEGDSVYAGTVLREGKLKVIASRVGSQTAAAQIVSLIESAPVTETRVQNYAEKFADRLVAPWLATSLGIFGVTQNLDRLLSMMIIDYGTGMRVAAPTSILACMSAAARQGILIKGGSQMEKLARADTLVFDKTGTLTRGTPHVVDVLSYNKRSFPIPKVLQIAAALEQRVNHPIAEAIVDHARKWNVDIPDRDASKYQVGLGVEAQVNGYYVHLGSYRFLQASGVKMDRARRDVRRLDERGCSTVVMAVDGQLVGAVACADEIRPESRDVIRALHNSGIKNVMMVTGDTSATAHTVAKQLGIDRVLAETMPDEKANVVRQLQSEGRIVVMVGDGINDSPALAYADVGIAMKNGTDVARESADVVLMEDNLWKLPAVIEFSHQAMSLVRQNYGIIVGLNTLATVLAIPGGFVSAGTVAALSNGSAILASLNAIRPLLEAD